MPAAEGWDCCAAVTSMRVRTLAMQLIMERCAVCERLEAARERLASPLKLLPAVLLLVLLLLLVWQLTVSCRVAKATAYSLQCKKTAHSLPEHPAIAQRSTPGANKHPRPEHFRHFRHFKAATQT